MLENSIEKKVLGFHLDGYGHVNNARYLEFLEEGRWELFAEAMAKPEFQQLGIMFVVVNININYRYPATVGDVLQIKSAIERFGETSMTITHSINTTQGKPVIDAKVTAVLLDAKTHTSVAIDDKVKQLLD